MDGQTSDLAGRELWFDLPEVKRTDFWPCHARLCSRWHQIVGTLIEVGFDGYFIDLRLGKATYYLPDGEGLELPTHLASVCTAAEFDTGALQAAIRQAQAVVPGYTYKGFCEKVKRAGCAGYMVSFSGRRVLYFGRTAETHV